MPTQRAECRPRAFLDLVVTPESIPQFTIPRLGSSSRSPGLLWPPAPGAAELYPGDLEPGTRLAMSLPHLRRVTTPYGFLALGKPRRSFSWDLTAPSCRFHLGVPEGKTRLQRLIRKHLSRAQKKRRAQGGASSGGDEEESSSSNGE